VTTNDVGYSVGEVIKLLFFLERGCKSRIDIADAKGYSLALYGLQSQMGLCCV
jgi:hypothetical protein